MIDVEVILAAGIVAAAIIAVVLAAIWNEGPPHD